MFLLINRGQPTLSTVRYPLAGHLLGQLNAGEEWRLAEQADAAGPQEVVGATCGQTRCFTRREGRA